MTDAKGPAGRVAVIAGRGALPRRIAEARAAAGLPYLLVIFPDCEEPWMAAHPHEHHVFEKLGPLFRSLRAQDVSHVVFAGAMNRPKLRPWRFDGKALSLAAKAVALLRKGDDAMLRGYAGLIEAEGFRMIGPQDILGGDLVIGAGALSAVEMRDEDRADAARAAAIVAALGPLDVGQGAVVAAGVCLAVEAVEGTDLMLDRVAGLPEARRGAVPSGVLYKGPKPDQDRRLDLPAIGPGTVEAAARAGLCGIVAAVGETVLLDRDEVCRAADRAGLFVCGAGAGDLKQWAAD